MKVIESVKKTGRVVLVSDACEQGSHISDMARNITELRLIISTRRRLRWGRPTSFRPVRELENFYYPQAEWIIDAINERFCRLRGHTGRFNFTTLEKMRREDWAYKEGEKP